MATRTTQGRRLRAAGLKHAPVESLSLVRRPRGRGFTYLDETGKRVRDEETLRRVRSLAIPPAYTDVRIAPHPNQHLQAIGRDDAGRLQYLYHPSWEEVREARKQDRLAVLCVVLAAMRRRLSRALRRPGVDREKVLAAAVMLIDRTHIRVGCSDYVHSGRSRGATTLLKRHVRCDGNYVRLSFPGKRRKPVECSIYAPALSRVLRELQDVPGRRMFQYLNKDGKRVPVSAADVNAYLRDISGVEVTAKDFRTLAATAAAGERLSAVSPASQHRQRQRQVAEVMREIALMLGNTPAVVRRSYVHRRLIEEFERGDLSARGAARGRRRDLSRGEALVAALFPPRDH